MSKKGYTRINAHSFRKWYATEIYNNNGCDIALVQRLLQHSSAAAFTEDACFDRLEEMLYDIRG